MNKAKEAQPGIFLLEKACAAELVNSITYGLDLSSLPLSLSQVFERSSLAGVSAMQSTLN